MFWSGYQYYPIKRENSHRIRDKQVKLELMKQRNDQTKLELEHNQIEADKCIIIIILGGSCLDIIAIQT